MVLQGKSAEKFRHASYLFKEMGKFQKVGILCDITVPGQLKVVPAHKIVLMSARSSEGDHPVTPLSPEFEKTTDFGQQDDVFLVDEAYSSGNENEYEVNNNTQAPVADRLGVLNMLRRQHSYCDVTLVVDNYRCDAHKVVLAACSGYFRAMFTSHMKENDMHTIYLQGVDASYFRRALDFIYTGELRNLDCEDAIELLKVAVFYQIVPMIDRCNDYLLKNMHCGVVCYISSVCRDLALHEVVRRCCSFIHDHFTELDFFGSEINLLHSDDLIACLRSERLGGISNTETEVSVLKIVLRWLLDNDSCQEDTQDRILSNVRFSLIPPKDIMSSCRVILEEHNNNCDASVVHHDKFGAAFKRHLLKALLYHKNIYEQPLLQTPASHLRTTVRTRVSVDGVLASATVKLPAGSKRILPPWTKGDAPIRDPFHSVVELHGFIYVIGGTRTIGEGYSRSVIRYDPRLDSSIAVADLLEPRGDFVALAHRGYIYAFGGRNRTGALDTCERYDPKSNTWEYIASLQQPTYMVAGVVCRGEIYITGGFNDYDTVDSMLCYHPDEDRFDPIFAHMMADRGYHVMIEGSDGRLWVMGGVDNPFSGRNVWEVEAFDIDDQMWHFVGQILPVGMFLSTVRLNVVLNDENHICVSAVTTPEKYPMLEYIPEKSMWFEMKSPVAYSEISIEECS